MLQINKSHARCVGEQRARAKGANGGGGGRQTATTTKISSWPILNTHAERERERGDERQKRSKVETKPQSG